MKYKATIYRWNIQILQCFTIIQNFNFLFTSDTQAIKFKLITLSVTFFLTS